MEYNIPKECEMKNRFYPNGADVGQRGVLLHCVNGKWEEVILVGGI